MALALPTIDAIFACMLVRYGAAWKAKWAGIPVEGIQADWARVLDSIAREAIQYGLDNLPPEWPPTAPQFREICLVWRAPSKPMPRLGGPKPNPQRVALELSRLRALMATRKPLDWAFELQEREAAGEILTRSQRFAWREALRVTSPTPDDPGTRIHEIQDEELPPAMRRGPVKAADVEAVRQMVVGKYYGARP